MNGRSHETRFGRLSIRFENREYREAYTENHAKTFVATQLRALRGDLSQVEFGKLIGKPQSVVSRLESRNYGRESIPTLIEIGHKLDVAVIVQFVGYDRFLEITDDLSRDAHPKPYEQVAGEIRRMAWEKETASAFQYMALDQKMDNKSNNILWPDDKSYDNDNTRPPSLAGKIMMRAEQ